MFTQIAPTDAPVSLCRSEILDVHRDDADMESIDKMTGADIPSETPEAKDA